MYALMVDDYILRFIHSDKTSKSNRKQYKTRSKLAIDFLKPHELIFVYTKVDFEMVNSVIALLLYNVIHWFQCGHLMIAFLANYTT